MPNNQTALDALLVKIDRASEHIRGLEAAMARFRYGGPPPYEILAKDDPQKGERTFYLSVMREMPANLPALIGDICQNLRSALDHLAWHLVQSSPVTPKARDADIYFPIFESLHDYEDGKMRKIRGMTPDAIKAIDEIQPYYRPDRTPGIGNGVALFWLHEINKLDKHRLLIPTWIEMTGHTLTKSKRSEMKVVLKSAFGSEDADVIMAAGPIDPGPLRHGSTLCTLPTAEIDEHMKIRLQIAFGEPKWVRGKEISSTLTHIYQKVRDIVVGFDDKGLL